MKEILSLTIPGAKLSSRTAVLRERGTHVPAASLEMHAGSRRTQEADLFAWVFVFTATAQ
jgi:hypothetical protein